jgi:uncharacterized protein with von Willebrand factor type A (vWA) domain
MGMLKDLARRAGRWLGLADTTAPAKHTSAVVGDRFDTMSWTEIYDQAGALRELADDLADRYDYSTDLLKDVFLGAYKTSPQLRERADMDPSRLVNHQTVAALTTSPEFTELHRETAGDPYAAAMAVLSQAGALRRILEQARDAAERSEQAAAARQAAEQAAQAVADALRQAGEQAGDDGEVPETAEQAVDDAIQAAQAADQAATTAAAAAEQALAAAAPGIRSAARPAAAQAAEAAREEAALMTAWGVQPGQLQRMSFDQRAQLAQRLRGGRLGRFAELIGRFRQMATAERARKIENAPGELVGITLGDDLARLVPAEVTNLGVPALRGVFAARYAEARLMIYDSVGETDAGQGAIIACIDCSGSMDTPRAGGVTAEAWAKACALALLDQARQAKRDFAGILFSSANQVKTFRFPAGEQVRIEHVVDFAEHFFGGGTDFQAPLSAAAELLAAEYNTVGKQRGDIVLITDGLCGVTEDWMRDWNDAKHTLGFRTFGVAIDTPHRAIQAGSVLDALCDNLRTIDALIDTSAAADLFRVI